MSQLVVLDESRSEAFPIYGVGGIVLDLRDLREIERAWQTATSRLALGAFRVKHSGKWPELEARQQLVSSIATLPVRCVVVLLEDFRPMGWKERLKERKSDRYVHETALEWLLQRLDSTYAVPDKGPHLVIFDHRDDLGKLADSYARHHGGDGWRFHGKHVRPPHQLGYSSSLFATANGPVVEIADLVVGAMTQWAGAKCAAYNGRVAEKLPQLERECGSLRPLFPAKSSLPECWRGYSIITFNQNRTGRELLGDHIDAWFRELPQPATSTP